MTEILRAGMIIKNSPIYYMDSEKKHSSIRVEEIFKDKIIVVFGGPAPFSRLDTEHATAYAKQTSEILNLGIDEVIAIYCQDAFVCDKFQEEIYQKTNNHIKIYGDGDGFFARDHGINIDLTYQGLCMRSRRWAAVINNCQVDLIEFDDYKEILYTDPARIISWIKSQ